jgi:hypothetical protein
MGAGALRARAFIAQIRKAVFAVMPVFPVDLDAFGLGDSDVFRVGCERHF